MPIDHLIL